ncbi:MAG: ribonuclease III [Acidobacteria bacterium]|nr:ribonuclease III [Acidobacteriota bacterium]
MSKKLAKLEQSLGHRFQKLELLERALTHRSWAHESLPDGSGDSVRDLQNESFEFVGDSVLGLAVAEQLFLKHPKASEGDLTLMKHQLVSTETLARLAADLRLGDFMRVGRGEEKTGGRRKQALLADTFEAILAAIFFDAGYIAARAFIARIFAEDLRNSSPQTALDYKTLLQETLQANKLTAPTYKVVKTEGPPHERTFLVEATWEGGCVSASGSSIKQAEMHAAKTALDLLERKDPPRARQKK